MAGSNTAAEWRGIDRRWPRATFFRALCVSVPRSPSARPSPAVNHVSEEVCVSDERTPPASQQRKKGGRDGGGERKKRKSSVRTRIRKCIFVTVSLDITVMTAVLSCFVSLKRMLNAKIFLQHQPLDRHRSKKRVGAELWEKTGAPRSSQPSYKQSLRTRDAVKDQQVC